MRASVRHLTLLVALSLGAPAPARADWLLIPFAGTAFGTETAALDLEGGTSRAHTVFGVSGAWLSNQILGVEADLMYGPRFFERSSSGNNLSTESSVVTLSGGVIAAVPLTVTRESLRPYLIGGLGITRLGINSAVFPQDRTFSALHVGGGAFGFVSPRTGYRFEIRHARSLSRDPDPLLLGARRAKLSFWRLTVGVVVRLG